MIGYGTARELLECLKVQLEEEGRKDLDQYVVLFGESPFKIGMEDCSQAWVRITGAYPSTTTGQADASPGDCGKMLGLQLEFGIMRCWNPPAEDEEPDPKEIEPVAAEISADIETLKRTILCCDVYERGDVLLGRWRPIGAFGVDVGGAWTLDVSLP